MHVNHAVERLFELAMLLMDGLEGGLGEHGLTRARAEVIWRLHHEGPMTLRQLSDVLRCTPRNVTGLIDALEAGEWVDRRPHPTDRRATLVNLTKRGRSATELMHAEQGKFGAYLFADFSSDELDQFASTLDQMVGKLRNFLTHSPEGKLDT